MSKLTSKMKIYLGISDKQEIYTAHKGTYILPKNGLPCMPIWQQIKTQRGCLGAASHAHFGSHPKVVVFWFYIWKLFYYFFREDFWYYFYMLSQFKVTPKTGLVSIILLIPAVIFHNKYVKFASNEIYVHLSCTSFQLVPG